MPPPPTTASLPRTVLVVPCYNEAARLDAEAFRHAAFPGGRLELLLVNDGSTDATADVARAIAAARDDGSRLLDLPHNQGKAEAVRAGVLEALRTAPAFVGFWDADLATPLGELPRFWQVMTERPGVELVMGSRVKLLGRAIERKPSRHYFGRVGATLIAATLGLATYDTQCGAKLFRAGPHLAQAFERPFLTRWLFDVEVIARYLELLRAEDTGRPAEDALYELPLDRWTDVPGSKVSATDFLRSLADLRESTARTTRVAGRAGATTRLRDPEPRDGERAAHPAASPGIS